ncbi:malto-oligosyltrehalose synthase [Kocuria sp.]|uniref:malto-oligosyltrehalose synthase n=1 Tax=Kocuria sp. TaxID=1871328 RepID=UPI0026DFC8AE|nr:malto-oligosyltrehalose synthase [Kocuria sp.]MDO5617349.1 malto-oligosyltrehalose synthase [Kocuria sp.]
MRIPASTYRLQITPDFALDQAAEQLEYLRDLGVDWIYLSPVLQATEGSQHGYDVVDPTVIDRARGGREAFDRLCRAAHEVGFGVIVDVVPNHQGVAEPRQNPWWWSLLKQGAASPHAAAFDVDWEAFGGKLMIPVLGDDSDDDGVALPGQAEQALSDLTVRVEDGEPVLAYWDNLYPLADGTYTLDAAGAVVEDAATVHERQHYRLVNWRTGDAALNYRRFFTVTTLAGVQVEDPDVLERSHTEIKRWFDDQLVDGLRIDHPDGLRDPGHYLKDLQAITGGRYVLIEKILEPGETLPHEWLENGSTAGTTGYDALGTVDRLFVDPDGAYPLTTLDASLRQASTAAGTQDGNWLRMIHGTKRAVVDGALHAEVERLAREAAAEPALAELSHEQLVDGLSEILANFDVYRTYLPDGVEHLEGALQRAIAARSDLEAVITQLGPVLGLTALETDLTPVARRFQQTSGMVMAKGVEDAAFYRYSRLTSLTEVGGDPSIFALSPDDVHAHMQQRHREEPLAMTTLSTHDTKRSESVRARISVLAEAANDWASTVAYVQKQAAAVGAGPLSDRTLGNLVLQALAGAWPIERERAVDYALKAAREAQTATAWVDGSEEFEQDLTRFVEVVLNEPSVRGAFEGFVRKIEQPGYSNALGQKLVQLTMPGVPDVYQGSELWAAALVDPDNRRPVDYHDLAQRLAAVDARRDDPSIARAHSVPAVDESGEAKLLVTSRALRLRRDRSELFTEYNPVQAQGRAADHLFGFDRGGAITLVTRLPMGLAQAGGWGETTVDLSQGAWVEELTGGRFEGRVEVAQILDLLPVALLRKA